MDVFDASHVESCGKSRMGVDCACESSRLESPSELHLRARARLQGSQVGGVTTGCLISMIIGLIIDFPIKIANTGPNYLFSIHEHIEPYTTILYHLRYSKENSSTCSFLRWGDFLSAITIPLEGFPSVALYATSKNIITCASWDSFNDGKLIL